ncbi:MAG: BamA/TamA family outer membrane protein [Candidatus Cloacimonetes bacterium]|nr:BamA/TamA family outer membrane protein [Candidatus Cloacimonadota bacterium]
MLPVENYKLLKIALILFCLLTGLNISAEKESKNSAVIYPYLTYSNETNLVFGIYFIHTARSKILDRSIPPSTIIFHGKYSLDKESAFIIQTENQLFSGKYCLCSSIELNKLTRDFYGIGNETVEDFKEEYKIQEIFFRPSIRRRLKHDFEIEFIYEIDNFKYLKTEKDGLLSSNTIPGSRNCLLSGAGFSLIYDDRDNSFLTKSGNFVKLENVIFSQKIGSDYDFSQMKMDARKFFPIKKSQILSFQYLFTFSYGTVPFRKLSDIGSKMRGYYSGRFIDNHQMLFRSEYKIFPWQTGKKKRIGFAAFVETGQVANELQDFGIADLKFCGGIGLRYILLFDEKLTLRLDYAVGRNSSNMILISKEAF